MSSRRLTRRLCALSALALGLAHGAAGASAATIPFGTSLDAPLVTAVDTSCAAGTWWYGPPLGNILSPASTGSCQFTALGFAGGTTYGLVAPASGTATAARIKVGAVTGPMRINVVRTLFQQTGNAASPLPSPPFLQAYGPTFTPEANAVTTIPLNLPMQAQATPGINDTGTVAGTDWLALEVLSSTVPVPVVASPGAVFFAAFPGPTASNVPAPSPNALPNYGQIGLVLAMNADLTTADPAPKPSTTPTPAAPAPVAATAPTVAFGAKSAKVAGGRAGLNLVCQVADCSGVVTLQRTSGVKKPVTTKFGSARFSVKAGQTGKVRVKLSAKGKALLKTKRKASVQAAIALDGGATPTVLPVTLRR